MAYADYEFYKSVYKGTAISESAFGQLSERASDILNYLTMNRIAGKWIEDVRVKKACCAVADAYNEAQSHAGLSGESVGSHSVTYADAAQSEKWGQYTSTASIYLMGTGLLYRGAVVVC